MTFEAILDKLFDHFQVSSISELADKLGVSQPAVSKWKTRNSVNAIKKKCRELGIYNDIFGDINTQKIEDNHGQIAQTVGSNQTFTTPHNNDEIDPATYNLFLESYQKAVKKDDLKGLRVHIMDY